MVQKKLYGETQQGGPLLGFFLPFPPELRALGRRLKQIRSNVTKLGRQVG